MVSGADRMDIWAEVGGYIHSCVAGPMSEPRRPFYPEVVLPESVRMAMDRESRATHEQSIRIQNWLIVQEAGRQSVYLLVAVRDLCHEVSPED